jgi:hypothetical protein
MAGRGRGWGAGVAHGCNDHFHHALDISEHIVVPESQHAIAAFREFSCTLCIAGDAIAFIVLPAIDDESRAMTGEISEVWTDRCLAAEMRARDFKVS